MRDTRVDLSHMRHPVTGAPLEPIGHRADGRPIWPIMGGAEPDDDDDDDDAGNDDDDDDAGDSDGDEEDPFDGLSVADKQSIKRAFEKSKSDAKKWREFAQGKTDVAPDGTKRKPKDDDPEDDKDKTKGKTFTRRDIEDTREEARAAGREELMPVLIEVAATHALAEAGMILPKGEEAREAKLARVMRMMDADDVRVEDGKLVGLSDAVAGLKRDFPEWFGKGTNGRGVGRPGNTGGGRGAKDKPKSATEIQMESIFGGND